VSRIYKVIVVLFSIIFTPSLYITLAELAFCIYLLRSIYLGLKTVLLQWCEYIFNNANFAACLFHCL